MGYFSNGTEAELYEQRYCSRCVHSDQEIGVDPPCPIWLAHILFAYQECGKASPAEEILNLLIPRSDDRLGNDECKGFHPRDAGAAIYGQTRLEVGT